MDDFGQTWGGVSIWLATSQKPTGFGDNTDETLTG
jgi:hypothetical protein